MRGFSVKKLARRTEDLLAGNTQTGLRDDAPSAVWRAPLTALWGKYAGGARRAGLVRLPDRSVSPTCKADTVTNDPIVLRTCRHTSASLVIEVAANGNALEVTFGDANIASTFDPSGTPVPGDTSRTKSPNSRW